MADALTYVHGRGVVHRDVKPSNILLDPAGTAHLADFGLARLTTATRITRTGQLVGTAAYLAPEQVRGGEIGLPVDVYALGLVLLECLTGEREYQGSEIEAAVARLHRSPAVPDDLPDDLRRLLVRMTSPEPERRPTARECARVLGGAEPQHQDAPPTAVTPTPRMPKKALLGAAAAVVGAAGIAWASMTGIDPPASAPPASVPSTSAVTTSPASVTTSPASVAEPVTVVETSTVVVAEERPDDDGKGAGPGKDDKPDPRGHGPKKKDP